ncbi:MAG: hypothetical protein IKL22_00360 [Lachnospiraceae bacterium]|nr:hypothetical protein [Lachnospiraceae bacterium]
MTKNRKEMPAHKVQIFRQVSGPFVLYYLQLCGCYEQMEPESVCKEMYKAFEHFQDRYRKKEEGMDTYLLYEPGFEEWLEQKGTVRGWTKEWKYPVYQDFATPENLQWILKQIPKNQYPDKAYVLGTGMGMGEWLPLVAGKVHHIRFYLEFATRGVEELQEMLLEEYGMLTEVLLIGAGEFKKLRLRSEEPVLVIDFSGQESIAVSGLKKGSIWVDMTASDAKRHATEDRFTGVHYYSLRTVCKRDMQQPLDIISKFAYNTDVKIGTL